MKRLFLGIAIMMFLSDSAFSADVPFAEDFALAKDRAAVLKQLIPGTEDYYYYHGLHFLNTEQFEKLEAIQKPWLERHGETQHYIEIKTRQMLLMYERDPKKTLEYVRSRTGVHFDHQKEIVGAAPNLPTALDPKRIARETLLAYSIGRWGLTENFEDRSLDWLTGVELSWEKRRNLLQRLTRPDASNLLKLIDEDLKAQHSGGFGSIPIHNQLTLAQLEEFLKTRPDLQNNSAFVNAYVLRLQPGADVDWKRDRKETLAYLERLQSFVNKLNPAHNSLKAHTLYHRLAFDRAQGQYDKARFIEYLKLPRYQGYMAQRMLDDQELRRYAVDLNAEYTSITMMPRIGADEELVRSYLKQFFLDAANTKEFEPYINDVYLAHLFAETKAENALGDGEEWASKLPPELFRSIKDRIDIDFAYTNKTDYAVDEAVKLDLFVKNVPSLLVKVFEINTGNVYRTTLKEIDTDINLDGLVANSEKVNTYSEPPLRRMARKFEFPELTKPGVYIIDFIGNGKSSRALIRKGKLRSVATTGSAGHLIRVIDEANKPVNDATIWLSGAEYTADKDGVILVPYSNAPGRRAIVVRKGEFASLDYLDHRAEAYSFVAGFHIDRESLLTQRVAQLLVRPSISLNGHPISVKLLEEVKLRITSTDHSNIPTSMEVPDFKLFEDRESTHEIRVPARLRTLNVVLSAKIKNLSTGQKIDVAASDTFQLNGIEQTPHIQDLHFAKFGDQYVIELLGRSGEAKPDRAVTVQVKHRDFKEPVTVNLKTDAKGRVMLGTLPEIASVTAIDSNGISHSWPLATNRHTYRQLLHAKAGDVVTLPYTGTSEKPSRAELALFEVRGNTIRADKFESLAFANGLIELRGLTAGDYDLHLKTSGEKIRIRVVEGVAQNNYVLGNSRQMQLTPLKPVAIRSITSEGDDVVVKLTDGSKFARVHVFATRYQPAFSAFDHLAKVRAAELEGQYPGHAESVYLTGRNIGDEYRYVLDRKGQKKFPGNMLDRPQLLLNPWAIRTTETGEQDVKEGEAFGTKGGAAPAKPAAAPSNPLAAKVAATQITGFENLDFLADASSVAVNLIPDKDGVVRLPKQAIQQSMIHIVAVDPLSTSYKSFTLPEQAAKFVDLRLATGLDPAKRFSQQKQVSILNRGAVFTLPDITASRFELMDSTAKIYSLFSTLSKDPKLAEFSFVLTWPKLKIEEKRTLFSKYSSHELNFFLFKKDREFFKDVVRPYLANKKDKTFLDDYLLENDLKSYLQPWKFGRLNSVERVLLAQRINGEPAKTTRHFDDMLKLQPPRTDRDLLLFDTAVASGSLGDDSFNRAKGDRYKMEQVELKAMEAGKDMPALAGAMPGGGGFGGGGFGGGFAGGAPGGPMGGLGAARSGSGPSTKAVEQMMKEKQSLDRVAGKRDGSSRRELADMERKAGDEAKGLYYDMKDRSDEAEFLGEDKLRRQSSRGRQLYRRLDPTMEWAENNYYHLDIHSQIADLIPVSPFWADYSRHTGDGPFLSRNLADASRNFTEMMFAISLVDLPMESAKHDMKFDGGKMTLTAASQAIAFHEEVQPVKGIDVQLSILVSQNFYRNGDRFKDENGERLDKFVTVEFLTHVVYGCQVVITNPTSTKQKLTALLQLPVGAIPVNNGQFTKSLTLDLEPYRTQTVDYFFYFPKAGVFNQLPVQVAKGAASVAAGQPMTFRVVEKPTKQDTGSWDYISQNGTNEEVLAFLNRENVYAVDLDRIAFRMKERGFFEAVTKLLHERHLYQHTLWSYGLLHADLPTCREFLQHHDAFVAECGGPITSPLLSIDPVIRHLYEQLEYKPLVNARAHSLGKRRQIVNDRFFQQYANTMHLLSYHRELDDNDKLAVTYYLLLQDRVEEAFTMFGNVNADKVATKLQYDYCTAYLDFAREDLAHARTIAMKHANHPVDKWRNLFATVTNQIDEAEGKNGKVADADNRDQKQGQLAATEPAFDFTVEGKNLLLSWQNVETVTINYYQMDVELLFSRNPFVQQSSGQFASIRPNATKTVKLPAGQTKSKLDIAEEFVKKNVLVEIVAAGKTRSAAYYANAMDVKFTENYGQVRVADADGTKPQSKVYVKVYAKLADGTVKFHKDGYTDIRGRFDYASVSTPERQPIAKFSVLVLSEDKGATIREVNAPQQ